MSDRKVVIFCSASEDINPLYNQVARKVVRAACLAGYDIVSGGTIKGTMRHVSDEAAEAGAGVEGILPRFMQGLQHPKLTKITWTDTMSERKDLMREGTCLAVALPGGIGTLDELAETYCLAKMGLYPGRVIALNLDGFYEPFKNQLDVYVKTAMLDQKSREIIEFPESVEELITLL